MDINLNCWNLNLGCLKVWFWGHFYLCCISTISLDVEYFSKWSCMLLKLPCIVILTVVTQYNDKWGFKKIIKWLAVNKLSLNVRKTKYMVFHTARKLSDYPVLQIDSFTIEQIQKYNFLEIHNFINNNLTWDTHQNHYLIKISKITGTMNSTNNKYNTMRNRTLQCIYNTRKHCHEFPMFNFITPHFCLLKPFSLYTHAFY